MTEERLHFKGVAIPQHISECLTPDSYFLNEKAKGTSTTSIELHSDSSIPPPCVELMATCHALALINGTPVGDPLEVEMFRASRYSISSGPSTDDSIMSIYSPGPPSPANKFTVLRHFEFTSDRARAGSLIQRPNGDIIYYSKGSPEAILKLVDKSTIPSDIESTLTTLSKRGLRVLAMSYKIISKGRSDDTTLTQSQFEFEKSSIFLGLVFLSNALKAETLSTIVALRNADIKCNMITGDHIHTAIAIATDCGLLVEKNDVFIIDAAFESASGLSVSVATTGQFVTTNVLEFLTSNSHATKSEQRHHTQIAITGQALEVVKARHTYLMKLLLESIQVFARMKPSDKQFIVEQLQHLTESDTKDMFADEVSVQDSDLIQISPDVPGDENHSFRKSLMENVASVMREDGSGSLHVIFCGDGKFS